MKQPKSKIEDKELLGTIDRLLVYTEFFSRQNGSHITVIVNIWLESITILTVVLFWANASQLKTSTIQSWQYEEGQ